MGNKKSNKIKIGTLNCQSIRNKVNGVLEHLINNEVDVCLMQETFLTDHDSAILEEIKEFGFKINSVPRTDGREHGGLAMLYKSSIKMKADKSKTNNQYKSFEFAVSTLKTEVGLIRFCNMYRPPYSTKHRITIKQFIEEFKEYLESVTLKPGYTVLLGDFNIHVEREHDYYVKQFNALLLQFGYKQIVPITYKTQICEGTLDLIIVTDDLPCLITDIEVFPHGTESDHFLVCSTINCESDFSNENINISYRNFKSLDINRFKEDLHKSELCNVSLNSTSLEDIIKLYQSDLEKLSDIHCPVVNKSKDKSKHKKDVWFDKELKEQLRKCRVAERKWRKSGLLVDKKRYKEVQKLYDLSVKLKRKVYNSNSIMLSKDNKRMLFSKINEMLGKKNVFFPDNEDHDKLANDFAEYFQGKVTNIRNEINEEKKLFNDEIGECEFCNFAGDGFLEFKEINIKDLKTLMGSMNNKFSSLDPVPSWLVNDCFDELGSIILHIINKSLSMGIFPSHLKKSVIKPTVKDKKGDLDLLSNYRPISNIPFISKVLEKVVSSQLDEYLNKNNMYCSQQSGYRKYHSCETLNVKMYDNILKDIDKGDIVALILLDMSAAFDTVDHKILLDLLKKCYGINGKVLNWFSTYLKNRQFSVNVYNAFSKYFNVLFGVPQGSILGPILFILYTKHLQHIALKYGLNIELYADDTQLYIGFKTINKDVCIDQISNCLNEIKHWVCNQFLKLNEDKTKLVLLAKPSVHSAVSDSDSLMISTINYNINEVDWEKESEIKTLGIRLDPNLDMSKHVSYIRQYCIGKLKSWKRISTFLDEDSRLLIVKQILLSKIDYSNALLVGLPNYVIQDLQYLINSALRFVYNVKYREHITPSIMKSHILPVEYRIDFKVCLLVFNCLHNLAPSYLQDLLQWNQPIRSNDYTSNIPRRSQDPFLLIIPVDFGNKTRYRWRSFSHYAPKCWNKLSYDIRSSETKDVFKTKLKTHFFNVFSS